MARLSDGDVARLIASLARPAADPMSDPAQAVAAETAATEAGALEQRLHELSIAGELGPLLTQRLASYVRRPLRCTSGTASSAAADGSWYVARCGGVDLWVRFDPLLVGALADAMIGGDGEAAKLGYGAKVARVAGGAAAQVLAELAAALRLPGPRGAVIDSQAAQSSAPAAGGDITVASHPYAWSAGVVLSPAGISPQPPAATLGAAPAQPRERGGAAGTAVSGLVAQPQQADALAAALERSRITLEGMLGAPVVFTASQSRTDAARRLAPGTLRVGSSLRSGGAVVLAVDRASAATLVNGCLSDDVAGGERSELVEIGAEVIADAMLTAFAAALGDVPDELRHIERLGDEAMLAALPHRSVDVRFTCAGRSGILRWNVPEQPASAHGLLGPPAAPVR